MSKRRCMDCSHAQPCGIQARYKRTWDETFHHLGGDTGVGSSLVKIMDAVAGCCVHFERGGKPQRVLPINPKRGT